MSLPFRVACRLYNVVVERPEAADPDYSSDMLSYGDADVQLVPADDGAVLQPQREPAQRGDGRHRAHARPALVQSHRGVPAHACAFSLRSQKHPWSHVPAPALRVLSKIYRGHVPAV